MKMSQRPKIPRRLSNHESYIFYFRIPKDRHCNRHWICHHGIHRIFRQTHPHSHQQHHCWIVDFLFCYLFFCLIFFQAVRMIQLPTFVLQHPMYTNFMNVQPLWSCYPKQRNKTQNWRLIPKLNSQIISLQCWPQNSKVCPEKK